jgi:hypothetical protein
MQSYLKDGVSLYIIHYKRKIDGSLFTGTTIVYAVKVTDKGK